MSETISELVEREAAAAEAEELEPNESTEPASEPEPDEELEPAAGVAGELESSPEPPSDVAAERALDAIGKAAQQYTAKVAKIQAATPLELVECPLCPVPGYVQVPRRDDLPEHVLLAVETYLAGPDTGMRQHPNLERCDTCDGWGNMTTGSRAGMVQQPCPDCNGQGYRDKRTALELERMNGSPSSSATSSAPAPVSPAAFGEATAGAITQGGFTFVPIPGASSDPAGRIAGHPLWGLHRDAGGI